MNNDVSIKLDSIDDIEAEVYGAVDEVSLLDEKMVDHVMNSSTPKTKYRPEAKKAKWDKFDAENMFNRIARDFVLCESIAKKREEAMQAEGAEAERLFAAAEAMEDCRGLNHVKVVDKRMDCIRIIDDIVGYDHEALMSQISYYEGYVEGLTELLEINRRTFYTKPGVVFGIYYTISEEDAAKYKMAFACYKGMLSVNTPGDCKNRYIISNDIDEVRSHLKATEYDPDTNTIYVGIVIYGKENIPTLDEIKQLSLKDVGNTFFMLDDKYSLKSVRETILDLVNYCVVE